MPFNKVQLASKFQNSCRQITSRKTCGWRSEAEYEIQKSFYL